MVKVEFAIMASGVIKGELESYATVGVFQRELADLVGRHGMAVDEMHVSYTEEAEEAPPDDD